MELNHALYTTRAMRRVRPDSIPESDVAAILDAAVRAPSGGNTQNWRFLTVTVPPVRNQLGPIYREAFAILQETVYKDAYVRARQEGDQSALAVQKSSAWLPENFEQVPLWLFAYSRNDPSGASIYPSVWSAMLAARGLGIGSCLTTILGFFKAQETAGVLGVPLDKGWMLDASVSFGYPLGKWGTASRKPVEEVTYAERWGNPVTWKSQPLEFE
ncbi:MAG: nitroreductase family protein [Acidimicrobiia bacterium]